jgi:hypothetical protein
MLAYLLTERETACPLSGEGLVRHVRKWTRVAPIVGASPQRTGDGLEECGEAFVGIDAAKSRNAVAVVEVGRCGEIRYPGEFDAVPDAVARLVRKLADRYEMLHFCYEAGPTGYGLYGPGPRVHGGSAVDHPAEVGRAGKDEPTRCTDLGPPQGR